MIRGIVFGSMPRTRRIARALSRLQSGKISEDQMNEIYRRDLKKFLEYIYTNNIHRSSDGMYRWDDLFNPLSHYMNIEVDGLKRFYDNNFFFRQPVFNKTIYYPEPKISKILIEDLRSIGYIERIDRISLSLPGPLTLAANSLINEGIYSSKISLARDYVEKVILEEITSGSKEGLRHIDLHEPELAFTSPSEDFIELYKRISEIFSGSIWIIIYFGYNRESIESLRKISAGGRIIPVIDLVSNKLLSKDAIEKIYRDLAGFHEIGLGVIDSRNTKIEKTREIRELIERLESYLKDTEHIYVTHNTNLEFLPEKVALRKIKLISRLYE